MTVRHEKCWLASTTIEVLVVAETKEKATEIASEALYQEMQNNDFSEPDLVVLAGIFLVALRKTPWCTVRTRRI